MKAKAGYLSGDRCQNAVVDCVVTVFHIQVQAILVQYEHEVGGYKAVRAFMAVGGAGKGHIRRDHNIASIRTEGQRTDPGPRQGLQRVLGKEPAAFLLGAQDELVFGELRLEIRLAALLLKLFAYLDSRYKRK